MITTSHEVINIDITEPDKHKLGQRPRAEIAKAHARLADPVSALHS